MKESYRIGVRLPLMLFVAFSLSACSAFVGSRREVRIDTSVPQVDIFVNGIAVGKSPVTAIAPSGERRFTVLARKDGYEPAMQNVSYTLSNAGLIDVGGAVICLFPGVGLLFPGAWCPETAYVFIPMVPIADKTSEPQKGGGKP